MITSCRFTKLYATILESAATQKIEPGPQNGVRNHFREPEGSGELPALTWRLRRDYDAGMNALRVSLVILFLVFSFNAVACLLPMPTSAAMSGNCSSADEQPVFQFCDLFKVSAFQAGTGEIVIPMLTAGTTAPSITPPHGVSLPTAAASSGHRQSIITTTVLRI